MRPLSRLLSVILALMLLAASLGTVSAGEFGAGPGQHGALTVVDWVSITVTRTDDLGVAQPGDILKFTITIERLMDGHDVKVGALGPATEADATFDDVADVILSDTKPYHAEEVEYEIRATDLGNAVSRTVPLTWQIARTIVIQTEGGSEHQHARSNSQLTGNPPSATVNVDVTKKPDVDAGGTELVLDFSGSTAPTTIEKGASATFKLVVSTGKHDLNNVKTLIVRRQLYDAAGEKVGNTVPAGTISIPALPTNAVSNSLGASPGSYALLEHEADAINDGGRLEFTYELTLTELDLDIDFNNDAAFSVATTLDLKGTIFTVSAQPEPTPAPAAPIAQNSAVTVTRGQGDRIDLALADGTMVSLRHGWIAADGTTRSYSARGYIREEEKRGRGGQTYAVVERQSDGAIVRVWIPAGSDYVNRVPWPEVLANYTFPTAVVEAIPLDETHAVANQLARYSGDERIYVYSGGEWRWIPDIPTFQFHGFYWCDVTAADAGFFDRVTAGNPLPRSGTPDRPDYPVCHNL